MSDIERLIIIILGKWNNVQDGWYKLHSEKFGICTDQNICPHDILFIDCSHIITVSGIKNNSHNMVFIIEDLHVDDGEKFSTTLKKIIPSNNKQVAIAVHHTSGRLQAVNPEVKGLNHVYPPKDFSRINNEENKIWNNLEPLINNIVNNACLSYREHFNKLWQCLIPKPSEVAHSLRSEILTPFIPFHLYHDLNNKTDDWNTILGECCAAINAKDEKTKNSIEEKFNTLIGLKSDLSDKTKNSARDAFEILKTNFQTGEGDCVEKVKGTDCRKTIEAFAKYLEEIVNSIEDWNTILGECCAAINAKDEKTKNSIEEKFHTLIGLKSDLSDKTKNSARDAFEILKTNFQTGEGDCVEKVKGTDCRETIEAFAKYLEEIVNSIEESKDN